MGVNIYLSDLKEEKQKDDFLGKGTEELKEKAEEQDKQIIVGEFNDKPFIEE